MSEVRDHDKEAVDHPVARVGTSRDSHHGTASRPGNATGQDKASRLVNITKRVAFVRDCVRLSETKVCSDLNPNRLGKATEVGTGAFQLGEGFLGDKVVHIDIELPIIVTEITLRHLTKLLSVLNKSLDVATSIAVVRIKLGIAFANLLAEDIKSGNGSSVRGKTGDPVPRITLGTRIVNSPGDLISLGKTTTPTEFVDVLEERVEAMGVSNETGSLGGVGHRHLMVIAGGAVVRHRGRWGQRRETKEGVV